MSLTTFVCPECNSEFGRNSEKKRHQREKHFSSKQCPFFPSCQYRVKRKFHFTAHMRQKHQMDSYNAGVAYDLAAALVEGNGVPPVFNNVPIAIINLSTAQYLYPHYAINFAIQNQQLVTQWAGNMASGGSQHFLIDLATQYTDQVEEANNSTDIVDH